jgi:hypothetical protein
MAKKKAVASKKAGGITKEMLKQLGGALAVEAGLPAGMGSALAEKGAGLLGLKKGGAVKARARGGYARGGDVMANDPVMRTPYRLPIAPGQPNHMPMLMMRGGQMVKARGLGGDIGGALGNIFLPGIGGILGQAGGNLLGSVFGFKAGGRVKAKHSAF